MPASGTASSAVWRAARRFCGMTAEDMGGRVAQAFAAGYPSRATALALIDTTPWYGNDAPRVWRERGAAARSKGLAGLVDFQITRWFGDRFRNLHPELVSEITRVF